jgi:hypothetical protein
MTIRDRVPGEGRRHMELQRTPLQGFARRLRPTDELVLEDTGNTRSSLPIRRRCGCCRSCMQAAFCPRYGCPTRTAKP